MLGNYYGKNVHKFKNLTEAEAKVINPQVLAFVGDSVYTLFIRTMLTEKFDVKSGKLHTLANEFVKAGGQSEVLNKILPTLTENEVAIFKRARNYKHILLQKCKCG